MGGASDGALTLGTAGHVDHGKSTLIGVLSGVDTDRLAEEKRRGISIVLGYAALTLPSGRRLSVIDVPGHERFVRTMVAGATGIDLFLMVVAADDGVMPQTREHARVLDALKIQPGVIAVTKSDLAPADLDSIGRILPNRPIVVCSARTGEGLDELRAELDALAARVTPRSATGTAVMHIDRVFSVRGAGTVVTGTLWSGTIVRGNQVLLLPQERRCRVRSVHIHDEDVAAAAAGQRVAVNLVGVSLRDVSRGDVLTTATIEARHVLDVSLDIALEGGTRVMVHHGTRESAARVSFRGTTARLRCQRPLLAQPGDRLVLRSIGPPDTLGGAEVLPPVPAVTPVVPCSRPAPPPPMNEMARALEERLRNTGLTGLAFDDVPPEALRDLRTHGRAERVGPFVLHPAALANAEAVVSDLIARHGSLSLAELRDATGTSRRYAKALLEHLDACRVTRRLSDDRRVLGPRRLG